MLTARKINIFDFLDYRAFLRAFYTLEKSADPTFSYRVFAVAVDIDASLLVKILEGKRHLSSDAVERIIDFFHFKEMKSNYFRELVAYGKARRDDELKRRLETLQKMRPAESRRIDEDRYRYFHCWHYPMIRSALDVFEYRSDKDAEALGNLCIPKLTAAQVSDAVMSLFRLGLVRKEESNGRIVPTVAHLSTGDRWQGAAVREYQRQVTDLAAKSLENTPKEERDISTLTLALDSRQMESIRAVIADARKSIVRLVGAMPPSSCDAVCQLNIQLFPVMKKMGSV